MRNVRKILLGIIALVTVAVSAAYALTIPPTYAPRYFPTQQTHYLRFTFNFNSCAGTLYGSAGVGINQQTYCSLKVGALPYNAFLVRAYQQTNTAFNSGTTDSLSVGTSSSTTGTLLIGQASLFTRITTGVANGTATIVAGNTGTAAVGNGIAQTGADGGFDVYAQYQQTGTAPTAGSATVVLEYIAPNDGTCAPVPMGSTAVGC